MVERTIKHTAIDLAGAFYDGKRSDMFRDFDALTPVYRPKLLPDGSAVIVDGQPLEEKVMVPIGEAYPDAKAYAKASWPLFVNLARQTLVWMLGQPSTSEFKKDAIHKALVEDRENQIKAEMRGKALDQPYGQVDSLEGGVFSKADTERLRAAVKRR